MQVPTSTRWVAGSVAALFVVTAVVWWSKLAEVGGDDGGASPDDTGPWLVVLLLLAPLPIAWCYRLSRWRLAEQAPGEEVTVRLYHGVPMPGNSLHPSFRPRFYLFAIRSAWALVEDGAGERWYQRLMWEPWLAGYPKRGFPAKAQRLRPSGPAIITTRQGGRLLWAGRPTSIEPMVEPVKPGPPARGGSRLTLLLPATVAGAIGWELASWAGAAVAFSYLLALMVFYGGPPLTRGGWFPRR